MPINAAVSAGNVNYAIAVCKVGAVLSEPKPSSLDCDVLIAKLNRKRDGIRPCIGELHLRTALKAHPARLKGGANGDSLSASDTGQRLVVRVVERPVVGQRTTRTRGTRRTRWPAAT